MENFSFSVEKLAGNPTEVCSSRVFSKRVGILDGSIGTLVGCIVLRKEGEGDLTEALTDIFDLSCRKLEESAGGMLSALSAASEAISDYGGKFNLQVEFANVFLYGDVCYLSKSSDVFKVSVFLNDASGERKPVEIKFKHGSGPLRDNQTYVVGTQSFFSSFGDEVFKNGEEISDIIDGLSTQVTALADSSDLSVAFISVTKADAGDEEKDQAVQTEAEESEKFEEQAAAPLKDESFDEPQKYLADETERKASIFKEMPNKILAVIFFFLSKLLSKIISEAKALRKGDVRAIFRARRNLGVIGVIFILILLGSVGWTIKGQRDKAKLNEFETHFAAASTKFQESIAIDQLNRIRARDLLIDAQKEINLALAIRNDERAKSLSEDLAKKLAETQDTSGVSFEDFYKASSAINSLSFLNKEMFVFQESRVVTVDMSGGSEDEVEVSQKGETGVIFDKNAFVLGGDKIVKVDLATKGEQVIGEVSGVDVSAFFGNIYVLNSGGIAKFTPIENGYVRVGDYLSGISLSSNSRMAIDGSVWVTNGKEILRYLRGEKQDFSVSGISSAGEFGPIYTNSALANIYVIDRLNSALLVISKEGNLEKVFQGSEFGKSSDLVIDDSETKGYLAVSDKILSFSLQ